MWKWSKDVVGVKKYFDPDLISCFIFILKDENDNIGFPYNSPANDYMLAVDELNGIGWLVSDRFQPEGKVGVYAFIYNDRRKSLELDDQKKRVERAMLTSMKDTWIAGEDYSSVLSKIKELSKASGNSENRIWFVVNDNRVVYDLKEFKNPQSKKLKTFYQVFLFQFY